MKAKKFKLVRRLFCIFTIMENKEFGQKGEDRAVSFLESKNYKILERNWQASHAEVDIIAFYNNLLVFIEVKTRSYDYFGPPEEFVSKKQQQNLIFAANRYMEKQAYEGELRFDIIAIIMKGGYQKINHIEDAFFPGL